jgi:hypothetical protein
MGFGASAAAAVTNFSFLALLPDAPEEEDEGLFLLSSPFSDILEAVDGAVQRVAAGVGGRSLGA